VALTLRMVAGLTVAGAENSSVQLMRHVRIH
jgi:hypothetical protein